MRRKVQNYLIPTEENEYTPHILQKVSAVLMLVLILISFSVANLQSVFWLSSQWLVGTVLPAVVVELTNTERTNQSLGTLTRSAVLDKAAQLKAEDMATHGYFAHNSPDGLTPWYWFDQAGYNFVYAGENLAVHFTDSENVIDAWMNSPGHRANILGSNYSEIGVGTAKGVFEGYDTVFVVQLFGTPTASVVTTPESNPESVILENIAGQLSESAVLVAENTVESVEVNSISSDVAGDTEERTTSLTATSPDEPTVLYSDLATTSRPSNPPSYGGSGDGGEMVATYKPTFLGRIATGPQLWLQVLYGVLALFVLLSGILSIIIEWRRHHPIQIAYGVGLMASMAILFYIHVVVTSGVTIA